MIIDVTITACCRPEILYRTLYSFENNLFGQATIRPIVNVDPIGTSHPQRVIDVVEMFYPHMGKYRIAEKPNFASAFKWTWEQTESEFIFHLEDDWELKVFVSLKKMIFLMEKYPELASLRLPQFKSSEDKMKNWDKFFPWNGDYFECPKELIGGVGFCGHPSLIRHDFVRNCLPYLREDFNPEKQFHEKGSPLLDEVLKWKFGVFGKPNSPNYIQDLGRRWMADYKFKKKGSKAFFLEWEREE